MLEGLVLLAKVSCPHPRSSQLTRKVSRTRKRDAGLWARGIREIIVSGWWKCSTCGCEWPGPSY